MSTSMQEALAKALGEDGLKKNEFELTFGTPDPAWQDVARRYFSCRFTVKNYSCVECKLTCNLDLTDLWTLRRVIENDELMDMVLRQSGYVSVNDVTMDIVTNQIAIILCAEANKVFNGETTSAKEIEWLIDMADSMEWFDLDEMLCVMLDFYTLDFDEYQFRHCMWYCEYCDGYHEWDEVCEFKVLDEGRV